MCAEGGILSAPAIRSFRRTDAVTLIDAPIRRTGFATTRHRWRRRVARCLLVVLAWSSLGALPWVVADFDAADTHHATGAADDAGPDASPIPGSPTHPADHNCPECQLLHCLAGCIPPAPAPALTPSVAACDVGTCPPAVVPRVRPASVLPPARAPPIAIA
jgi:hypothetical protein